MNKQMNQQQPLDDCKHWQRLDHKRNEQYNVLIISPVSLIYLSWLCALFSRSRKQIPGQFGAQCYGFTSYRHRQTSCGLVNQICCWEFHCWHKVSPRRWYCLHWLWTLLHLILTCILCEQRVLAEDKIQVRIQPRV